MAWIGGSNFIQFRKVMQKELQEGGYSFYEAIQFRTKDITSSILGLIPLTATWSEWQTIPRSDYFYIDEHGIEITEGV